MKRVASLYLPNWSIDRVRRAERQHTPPPERGIAAGAELAALKRASDAEQGGKQCDAPRNSGWRPGARWARSEASATDARPFDRPLTGKDERAGGASACWAGETRADVERRIARMEAHQRPPMREMGRRSEAAEHAFKRLPGDDGNKASGWPEPGAAPGMVAVRFGGEGVRPTSAQRRRDPVAVAEPASPRATPHDGRTDARPRDPAGASTAGSRRPPVACDAPPVANATPADTTPQPPARPLLRLVNADAAARPATTGAVTAAGTSRARTQRAATALRPAISAIRYPGEGPHPDNPGGDQPCAGERRVTGARVGSNDAGASVLPVAPFFDTGRSTAGTLARVCPADGIASAANPANASPLDHPHAAPLVTVHKIGSRIEVAAACPAARRLGIDPGMALTQVRAATPDVRVRDADPAGDRAALDALAVALARRWSPCVSVSDAPPAAIGGEAGLFIDLTGVAHLHGGEHMMARRIVRLLARLGIAARIGIADTPAAAWALARFAPGPVAALPPAHGIAPFADYPVTALRLEAGAVELMRRLGIDQIGALAAMPRAPMARRFGHGVATRLDQLIGAVAEPVAPVIPRDPVVVEQRFAEPILTAEPIAYWIAQLSDRLAQALAQQGRGARALVLALTRVDGAVQAVRVGFARATRDAPHMLRLLVRRIELIDPGFGIEIMALHVTRDEPLGAETLAGDLEEAVPDLAALVDAIVNRIGEARLWRTRAVESDVPERSVAAAAPLDRATNPNARLVRDDVRHLDTRGAAHPWHPRWPRPARLLRRPEPIDHVMAELPDSYPKRFRWRGQMHQVVRGDGPERIAGEWWRRVAERQAVRDYFQVEDDAGQRFWLFRRGDGQRPETGDMTWHLHGTFG
jgi:protein ImuB